MKTIWNLPKIEIKPFAEIHEKRRVALVTSPPAWDAVKDRMTEFPPASIAFVQEATLAHWNKLTPSIYSNRPEVVYSAGGGLTADAGKYIANLFHLPLVCLPTTLSVDAFFTAAAGIREDGCVKYIETRLPIKW